MKNFVLFFLSMICVAGNSFAQSESNITAYPPSTKSILPRVAETTGNSTHSFPGYRTFIYSESFDGGLPVNWSTQTTSGPCSWMWTDVGHQGDFPSEPLESTTASNGWMILDSDYCNFAGASWEGNYLTSPAINCSGQDVVSIRFQQYFRRYINETTTVQVSVDGGASWTSFIVNEDVDQAGTLNPDVVQINISDLAANQPDVRVRFKWQGNWDYGWQIDDFALIVPLDNDLSISSIGFQLPWDYDEDQNFRDLEYSIYPADQLRELHFNAKAFNNGGMAQTNVVLQVDINGPNFFNQTLSSGAVNIASGEFFVFELDPWLPLSQEGSYTVDFIIISDDEDDFLINNSAQKTFAVSTSDISIYPDYASTYGRDSGSRDGAFTNFYSAFKIGNAFYIENPATLLGLGVALALGTVPGDTFNMELLSFPDLNYIAETSLMTSPNINQLNGIGDSYFQWAPFESPIELVAGVNYVVVVNHFGGDDDVVVATSGYSPDQSSFYYDGSEATWYYTNATPMVRMVINGAIPYLGCIDPLALNYDPFANIDDGSCEYPNPFECEVSYEIFPDTISGDVIWVVLDYSSAGNTAFHWDFGDGNESTETYPTHTYDEDGDYLVCVTITVTDDLGDELCADQFCDIISSDFLSGLVERPMQGHRQNGFTINVINPLALSVSETQMNRLFTLFPNPTTGLLNVVYSGSPSATPTIQFYDLSGRMLESEVIPALNDDQQLVFDISNLPAGIYFVSIESPSGRETHKLMKQ